SIEASRSKHLGTQAHVDSEGATRLGSRRRADVERVHVRADTAKSKCSGALFDESRLLEKRRRSRLPPKAVEGYLAEIDLVGIRVDVRLDQDVNGEADHPDRRVAALELERVVVAAGCNSRRRLHGEPPRPSRFDGLELRLVVRAALRSQTYRDGPRLVA